MVDQTGAVPVCNDRIHIFKTVSHIADGKIIMLSDKLPQIITPHHVDSDHIHNL